MRFVLALVVLMATSFLAESATIKIPKDFETIQDGIDASSNGDMVLVYPGTYVENVNFKGKAIALTSFGGAHLTFIDGKKPSNPDYGSVVVFESKEDFNSALIGFTIINGSGTYDGNKRRGGGIYCYLSSPTLKYNKILNNTAEIGGGICCKQSSPDIMHNTISGNSSISGGGIRCGDNSSPSIINNIIAGNTSDIGGGINSQYSLPKIIDNTIINNKVINSGGGINCQLSSPDIKGNTITENSATVGGGICCKTASPNIMNNTISYNWSCYGGGIYCNNSSPTIVNNLFLVNTVSDVFGGKGGGFYLKSASSPTITNNTITGNASMNGTGGGIYCFSNSNPIIRNSIIWGNSAPIDPEISGTASVMYCNVMGGYPGTGNMNLNPCFVKGQSGDYYLSQTAAGQSVDSPCLDAGNDLASNLGMDVYWTRTDEKPDSDVVDMGFHYGSFAFLSLQTDTFKIKESVGGAANLRLNGKTGNANRNYLIFGSVSGISPGIVFPISNVNLPINWDIFTNLVITYSNQPFFQNFMGTLDSLGSGGAILNLPPVPGFSGTTMSFSYGLVDSFGTWDFASNPVTISIVP